jgi:TrmH family RNA methyltransferase
MKKISGTNYLIPFIGVTKIDWYESGSKQDFVLLLDDVRDHGNIGTIIRTANAFNIRDIFATNADFDPYYRKTIEASRGTVFKSRIRCYESGEHAVNELKQLGFQIVATSPSASQLQSITSLKEQPIVLVVGNETHGVSEVILRNADLHVRIPMSSGVDSLNVGVATGISIYELKLKLVLHMLTSYIRKTLGREINVTGKLIQRMLDTRLKAVSPFDSTQIILMMIMKCDEKMTLEQISKDTATFGKELSALLQPLLEGRYIQDEHEVFRLTEKGEHLLSQLWGVVEASETEVMLGFTDNEKELLIEYLGRIRENCQRYLDL